MLISSYTILEWLIAGYLPSYETYTIAGCSIFIFLPHVTRKCRLRSGKHPDKATYVNHITLPQLQLRSSIINFTSIIHFAYHCKKYKRIYPNSAPESDQYISQIILKVLSLLYLFFKLLRAVSSFAPSDSSSISTTLLPDFGSEAPLAREEVPFASRQR